MNHIEFAKLWIDKWNTHNIEEIMDLYSEDIEVTSSKIKLFLQKDIGSLQGKELVKNYWTKALQKVPDLHFTLLDIASGINSVAIYYKSPMGIMAMGIMFFNEAEKVNEMFAPHTNV